VNLTAQQRTRIQQNVLAGRNVPRVDNVNFSLSVGTVVPSHVRIVNVPPALIEINPAWRGHQYFVVRDEIVIVDHSRKVVAAVPVGSSGAQLHNRGGASNASAIVDLPPDQIREIQIVLKEKGFNVEVDGRLGPRTRQALIAFQRQQGFTVSGRIDNQTVTALGLSNKIGAHGGAPTGQDSGAANQGGAAQQPAHQNQGAKQPSTSGQGSASPQQAPAQEDKGASRPSTNGQGKTMQNQEPAQQNQGASKPSTSGQSSGKAQERPAEQSGSSK
jgi:peptidoglycan hydrolase-like protein with peptidoglycan-binding domain